MIPLTITGPPENFRLNFIFLPDGYKSSEESVFMTQARKYAGAVVSSDPFGEYAFKMNFYAKFMASNESGISKPLLGITKDSYFKCQYGWGGNQRTIGTAHTALVRPILAEFVQVKTLVVFLCNDSEFGGGGGPYLFASRGFSTDNFLHELGHFFGLEDEYYTVATTGYAVPAPNVALGLRADQIPWYSKITPGTPLPTKISTANNNKIGCFEGASGIAKGVYRPFTDCKMKTVSKPWCPICRNHIISQLKNNL